MPGKLKSRSRSISRSRSKRLSKKYIHLIPKLKKGELGKFGYSNVLSMSIKERHQSLTKAIKSYGALAVFRKINALYVLNKNKGLTKSEFNNGDISTLSILFDKDKSWIKKSYKVGKVKNSKSKSRSKSKKRSKSRSKKRSTKRSK